MKKLANLSVCLLLSMMFFAFTSSCSKDSKDEPSSGSPIIGTWFYSDNAGSEYDEYTLVFNGNNTGYIINEYGTKASVSEQMNFDWSLTTTSDGSYRLSVIYTSGDRYMDGPFGDGYAQWNRNVTIAGNTLSINMGDGIVMLFRRK